MIGQEIPVGVLLCPCGKVAMAETDERALPRCVWCTIRFEPQGRLRTIRCRACRSNVSPRSSHVPRSEACEEARIERLYSITEG